MPQFDLLFFSILSIVMCVVCLYIFLVLFMNIFFYIFKISVFAKNYETQKQLILETQNNAMIFEEARKAEIERKLLESLC